MLLNHLKNDNTILLYFYFELINDILMWDDVGYVGFLLRNLKKKQIN